MQLPERRVLLGIGFFLGIAILLLTYFVFKLQGITLKPCTPYRLLFEDITGIPERSEVRTRGVVVGRVQGFRLLTDSVEVRICLTAPVALHEDAVAVVRPKSLLGERFVDLRPGATGAILPPDTLIRNTLNPVRVEDLGELLSPFLKGESFTALAQGLQSLAAVFARNPTELTETLEALGLALRAFGELARENREELHTLLKNLARFSAVLGESNLSPQELHQLLRLFRESLESLNRLLAQLERLSQESPELARDLRDSLKFLREALVRVKGLDPDRFLLVLKKIIQEEGITVNIFGYSEERLKEQLRSYPRAPTAP